MVSADPTRSIRAVGSVGAVTGGPPAPPPGVQSADGPCALFCCGYKRGPPWHGNMPRLPGNGCTLWQIVPSITMQGYSRITLELLRKLPRAHHSTAAGRLEPYPKAYPGSHSCPPANMMYLGYRTPRRQASPDDCGKGTSLVRKDASRGPTPAPPALLRADNAVGPQIPAPPPSPGSC